MKRNSEIFNEATRHTRSLFYIRAKYSYAVVEKENIADNTKEYIFFDPKKLTNKWLKELYSPHFLIIYYPQDNKFIISDINNQGIYLNVYFYKNSPEAYDKLTGMIAIDRLNQSIDCLNEWVNESLNVDPTKLREKVKALIDMVGDYPRQYKLVK